MLPAICSRLPKEEQENQIIIVDSLKSIKKEKLKKEELVLIFNSLLETLLNWTTINSQHLIEGIEWTVEIIQEKG